MLLFAGNVLAGIRTGFFAGGGGGGFVELQNCLAT